MKLLDVIFSWRKDVGVALGAGGARGVAHFGALQAIQKHGFRITSIAGSSMGAVAAAMFAFNTDADIITKIFCEYAEKSKDKMEQLSIFRAIKPRHRTVLQSAREVIFKFFLCSMLTRKSNILAGEILYEFIADLLPDADIREASIPLAVVTFDITALEPFIITEGSVRDAVTASSSIPGVFPPVKWDGKMLVDGGGVSPVPVVAAKQIGSRKIIAVDVSPEIKREDNEYTGMDIILRTQTGESKILKKFEMKQAWHTIVINLEGINWWNFEYYESVVRRGFETAMNALDGKKQ